MLPPFLFDCREMISIYLSIENTVVERPRSSEKLEPLQL